MRKCRKLLARLGLPTVVIAASVALAAGPAAAEPIIHPDDVGPFNVDVQAGSSITINPSGRVFSLGTGACVDGEDNDLDGYVDFGPDPDVNDDGCVAASDRSERAEQNEDYAAPRLSPSIDENGVTTLEPAGVQFQEGEVAVDVSGTIYILGISIEGVAPAAAGTLDPATGAGSQDLRLRLGFRGIQGLTLPPTCAIGPIVATGDTALYTADYTFDEFNGYATFSGGGVPVPPAMAFGPQACGVFGAAAINIALGLGGGGATADATFVTVFDRPIRPPA
ncbi:MAG: hypothetical protein ACT4PI_02945 [Actinomycetota bacterium]